MSSSFLFHGLPYALIKKSPASRLGLSLVRGHRAELATSVRSHVRTAAGERPNFTRWSFDFGLRATSESSFQAGRKIYQLTPTAVYLRDSLSLARSR
jgi:hypothetical protein